MADEFDRFLQQALAPAERDEDHSFVARVQAAIALEERFRIGRKVALRRFALELVALAAVTAALLWAGRAPAVAGWVDESPWLAALVLMIGFGTLIALFGTKGLPNRQVQDISGA